jgi:hypothetical protein
MSSDEDTDNGDPVEHERRYRTTTMADRYAIFMTCKSTMVNGRLKSGIQKELAELLGISSTTVSRQWSAMNLKLAPLLVNQDDAQLSTIIQQNLHILFSDGKSSRKQGKYKYDRDLLIEQIKMVPIKQRRSVKKLAMNIGMAKTTIHQYIHPRNKAEQPLIIRHISKLHPTLTDSNKEERYLYACSQLNTNTSHLMRPRFQDLMDVVHIDEKWFHLCQDGEGYLLVADEEEPVRYTKHKSYIGKVMFLAAVARPRWDYHEHKQWDGKIGIWPIGNYTKAKRNSVNRPAGTTEWENVNIDHELYRDLLVDHVFTEIMNKWPVGEWNNANFKIRIQQDGAGGHTAHDDPYLTQALEDLGLTDKVSIYTQPPNSPDLNILDLGLFNALQAEYYDTAPKNEVELITMVEQTFANFCYLKINRLFVTLQTVFNGIIEAHGGNDYKLEHMNKDKLEREGRLPLCIVARGILVDE